MKTIQDMIEQLDLSPLDKKSDLWFLENGDKKQIIQFKQNLRGTRDLYALLLALAMKISAEKSETFFYLVLLDPGFSQVRLENELMNVMKTFRKKVHSQIIVVSISAGETFIHWPQNHEQTPSPFLGQIELLWSAEEYTNQELHRPDYFFMLLKTLLHRLFLKKGPVAINHLMKQMGCSYPTLAKKLRRLEPYLIRHSNRQVELARFPTEPWEELLVVSKRVRQTTEFIDRSGKPRTPEALLRRLQKQTPPGVAVGGIYGAFHWDNELDLQGAPRLDLSLHCPDYFPDLSFVGEMDPALKSVENPQESVTLAVHLVCRSESLFEKDEGELILWADPVECLLDLYELRLNQQANTFLESYLK